MASVKLDRWRAIRWQVFNEFVDESMRHLRPAEVRVWLVLYRDAKPRKLIRTAQTDIARRGGLSVKAAGTAVRSLVDLGLVQVMRRGSLKGGPSVYQIRGSSPVISQMAAASEASPDAEVATAMAEPPVARRAPRKQRRPREAAG